MNHIWLLFNVLFLITTISVATVNVGLETQQGTIYGRQTQYSTEYLGIQYAKVIRWKPPIDLASKIFANGSLEATSFGPCCPQASSATYIPAEDEQCLYLNIYKPLISPPMKLYPVFVWIHGGAHSRGCASERIPLLFNGTSMIANAPLDQPVIVITINYRLGPLADMFLKELIEEDPSWPTSGNYMYLDMLSALRWIKKNIEDYGGDPMNVSLFGQSAGGLSVVDLGAVRGSIGLYRTAISESGLGSPGTYTSYYSMSDALQYSNGVVQRLNCTNEDQEKVLLCIRNSSIEEIFRAYGSRYTRPIIDDYFFPLYPPLSIKNGTYNNISLIMGHNDYEQAICSENPDMNLREAIEVITKSVGSKWISSIIEYYDINNCSSSLDVNVSRCCDIVRMVLLDKMFDCDIRRILNSFYLKSVEEYELYSYHLNCYPGCPVSPYKGICSHSQEVPYVFGIGCNLGATSSDNCTWDDQSREFSNGIIAEWMNIASTGRPLNPWPRYDPSSPKYYHITPDEGFSREEWNRNCSFFDQMEFEGAQKAFGNADRIIL